MAWEKVDNINLADYSTMNIGGVGSCLITTDDPSQDLKEMFSSDILASSQYHIVGEGSNSIFAGDFPDWCFICLDNKEITTIDEADTTIDISIRGGCSWDSLVEYAVLHNLHGIEMMSAIPGTVGAAPVQNIGAYGGEFADVCISVDVFDTQERKNQRFSKEDCDFGYRNSVFKENPGRYIVYSVTIRLEKKKAVTIPSYPGVAEYLEQHNITDPTLTDIRETITNIRWGKLPRPSELANCGSFFKNAIVSQEHCDRLLETHSDLKYFPVEDGLVKIPTGHLIDSLGLKGYRVGDMGIYEKHALIIVNYGNGTIPELLQLIRDIQEKVYKEYEISIEPEVNIIMPYEKS